ncbi:MAG: NYN domain-containing protein, partial [Actinobacteria bacterium]|nr:NYN domain-containing protein [Actinomycetota bacterium]
VAREATRQAEAELLARGPGAPAAPLWRLDPRLAEARESVSAAAERAADLARALGDVVDALAPDVDRTDARRPRFARRPPALPAGLADDAPEAHRHLVAASGALLVVDGYNVARTTWPDLEPEEERRRTVALLEEHRARTGVPITVVFDGDSDATAPAASRSVQVRFSPTGVTADEAIAHLLAELPASQPVVVVSSDREVADDARRQGAAVLSSPDFLAALGR